MRKIIDGKCYDDEDSKILSWDRSSEERKDTLQTDSWTLYKKDDGTYFKKTEFYVLRIEPIEESLAKKWVEENRNTDYEKIFGKVEE